MKSQVSTLAHPVQGLLCGHGYENAPARTLPIECVFVSLAKLEVRATVTLEPGSTKGFSLSSNGQRVTGDALSRMKNFLKCVLPSKESADGLRISLSQNFDSAIGIGSSAAVYASVALGVTSACGLQLSQSRLSALARLGSYSAAAAITGNVCVIKSAKEPEKNVGEMLCPAENFPFRVLVLPIRGQKQSEEIHRDVVGSRFYSTWLEVARETSAHIVKVCKFRKWHELGQHAEGYIYENLSVICTGPSRLLTWTSETLRAIRMLRDLREKTGNNFFISMNSGPAVFVYSPKENVHEIMRAIRSCDFTAIDTNVGSAAKLLEEKKDGQ